MIFPLSHQICYHIRAHKFVHFRLRCQRVAVLGKTAPGDVPLYADEASGKVYEAMPCIRRAEKRAVFGWFLRGSSEQMGDLTMKTRHGFGKTIGDFLEHGDFTKIDKFGDFCHQIYGFQPLQMMISNGDVPKWRSQIIRTWSFLLRMPTLLGYPMVPLFLRNTWEWAMASIDSMILPFLALFKHRKP